MKIEFNTVKDIVIRPAENKVMTNLIVERMIDLPEEKKVIAYIQELMDGIVLWSGDEYDAIGQWTDEDAVNRIKELYKS